MKKHFFYLTLIALSSIAISACGGPKEIETTSGFKVIFHKKGKGEKPIAREWVYFKYSVSVKDSLLDYTKEGQPVNRIMMPDQINDAEPSYYVLEAFEHVTVGDSIELHVPINVIPGPKPEFFAEDDVLIYGFLITDIKDEAGYQADLEKERIEYEAMQAKSLEKFEAVQKEMTDFVKDFKAGNLDDKLVEGPEGLRYLMLKEGNGTLIVEGQTIDAHYYGTLPDGTPFDASYQRGNTFNFMVGAGQVIRGWDEGFKLLSEGAQAILVIPAELGYGEQGQGQIPPNSILFFHVSVEKAY